MIQTQVKNTIEKHSLIENGDKVLACISGGPDSMALLHLLATLRRHYDIELTAAHLDHMIRGKQSAADANFVRKAARKLKIPFIMESCNVRAFAKSHKMSLEEAAREVRYNFYQRAAEKADAKKIATGHTIDDQAETVLMRLIKGSGSRGLSGIPYKRQLGNVWVIRPLLDVTREDIERYLKKERISSRVDASNLKTFYLRNKIRHILIPLLEKEFNPKIKESLNLVAKSLSGEFDYLNTVANRRFRDLTRESKSEITVRIDRLLRQPIALQRLIVRQILHKLKGDLQRVTYKHWQQIESLISAPNKTAFDMPDKIKVKKKGGYLIFTKGPTPQKKIKKFKKIAILPIPGEIAIPELGIKVCSEVVKSIPKFKKGKKRKRVEYINGNSIVPPLKIRTWHTGDRMRPLGMKYTKKLHDIFIDEKVPREERDRIPLIVSGRRILWAASLKLSEDYKVEKDTKKIIKLSINPFLTQLACLSFFLLL